MKVWFITGASRGFGALIAKEALERGDQVVATGRNPGQVREVLGESENLLILALDVRSELQVREAVRLAAVRFGRIDVLVNNAGYGLLGAVEEANAKEVEEIFATNVFGLLQVTRAVLPLMRRQRSGHVLNFSSIGGYASFPGWGVYCATKFAVEGISEALSLELAPLGLFATVIEPGFFRTDFLNDNSLVRTQAAIEDYAATVGAMRTFAEGANHQQPGDPRRLARIVVRLSDEKNPPRRLALGTDTLARIEEKNLAVMKELDEWRRVSASTDFTADGF